MSVLLFAAMLAVGADDTTTPQVNGKYMIVYAEEGGRRNNSWEQRQATVRDNTLTYEADGKEHAIQLKFGPNQTLEASQTGGEGHKGVYIAGKDYLCLSLESGKFSNGEAGAAAATKGNGGSSGSFILILRRQREAGGQ
jgi:hypothetical protein